MRVLITCVSGYGHLHPLLPLARALVDARHEVAIATGAEMRRRAGAAGFAAFDAGISLDEAFGQVVSHYPDGRYNRLAPDEILGWWLPHLFGEIIAPAMLADLEPLAQRWRPDIVLHDIYEFAGPIVAARLGIPSVSHTLGPRVDDQPLAAVASAVAPLWQARGLVPDPTAGVFRSLCLDITPPGFQREARFLRHRAVIQPIRPLAPPPLPGERLPEWISHRRPAPLIYMTLGTNTNTDMAMFRSVVDGLSDLDVEVLMTVGVGGDTKALEPLPRGVHVETYVPQSLLLPHCAAVICHGGAGTTLGALAEGLPLLVLPQGADQYLISECVVAAGVGLCLTPSAVNPASIRACVAVLLDDPLYTAAAYMMQREIAAMPGPAETVPLVESVAARADPPASRLPR